MIKPPKSILKLRNNSVVRILGAPLFYVRQCLFVILYQFSEDSRYVKTFWQKHKGERCFIIGNGPSLTASDLEHLKGEISFGSNRIFKIYDRTEWRPTYYLCIDPWVGKESDLEIRELKGSIKFRARCMWKKADRRCRIHHLVMGPWNGGVKIEKIVQKKFTTALHRYISRPGSVTCTAIEMAVYMGIKEIYLLGVDHTFAVEIQKDGRKVFHEGKANHFAGGESSWEMMSSTAPAPIEAGTQSYQVCQDYALAHGIKIYNCTRGGNLEVFERKDLEEVLGLRGV